MNGTLTAPHAIESGANGRAKERGETNALAHFPILQFIVFDFFIASISLCLLLFPFIFLLLFLCTCEK